MGTTSITSNGPEGWVTATVGLAVLSTVVDGVATGVWVALEVTVLVTEAVGMVVSDGDPVAVQVTVGKAVLVLVAEAARIAMADLV